jgi:hypothetical protein
LEVQAINESLLKDLEYELDDSLDVYYLEDEELRALKRPTR